MWSTMSSAFSLGKNGRFKPQGTFDAFLVDGLYMYIYIYVKIACACIYRKIICLAWILISPGVHYHELYFSLGGANCCCWGNHGTFVHQKYIFGESVVGKGMGTNSGSSWSTSHRK